MKDVVITLSGAEVYAAKAVALQIQLAKEKTHVVNKRICSRDDLRINLDGQMAEIAVSRYLGLDYNPKIHLRGDGGVDFNYRDNTLQVKSTQTNYLLFPKREAMTCDLAILCTPSRDKHNLVFIRGWIDQEDWFQDSRDVERIPGVISCGVEAEKLYHIDELDIYITCKKQKTKKD